MDSASGYRVCSEHNKMTASKQPGTVKAFNLVKSIGNKVQRDASTTPYPISIGELADKVAEAFEQRQI